MEMLKAILKKDRENILIWHRMEPNRKILNHLHDDCDEYILVVDGKFTIIIGDTKEEYDLNNQLTLIHIPVGISHSLLNGPKATEYFVVKVYKDGHESKEYLATE